MAASAIGCGGTTTVASDEAHAPRTGAETVVSAEPKPTGWQPYVEPPFIDADADGLADSVDKCPDIVGPTNNDGCPRVLAGAITGPSEVVILETVIFKKGSPKVEPSSFALLDTVAEVLEQHPELGRVQIEGNTSGEPSGLGKRRAQTVLDYLVKKGVDKARLEVVDLADTKPIADPKGSDAAKNRRVSFKIVPPAPSASTAGPVGKSI